MIFFSNIHGDIEYEENEIITFNKGIPGFNELKKFIIVSLDGYEPFKLLHSLEDKDVGLIVTSPYEFFKDYEIKLNQDTIKNLEIRDEKEVKLLTTVTLNSDIKKITTNLRGPIVINIYNNLGEQIVIDDSKYELKSLLIKE